MTEFESVVASLLDMATARLRSKFVLLYSHCIPLYPSLNRSE